MSMIILMDFYRGMFLGFLMMTIIPFVLLGFARYVAEDEPKKGKKIVIIAGVIVLIGLGLCNGMIAK